MLSDAALVEALEALGGLLESRGEEHDLVLIGGGALLLLGAIERPTKDLDVVARFVGNELIHAEPLPQTLLAAIGDVAAALALPGDWLNAGPAALLDFGLPEGFEERLEVRKYGALTIRLASRRDQVSFKLYAVVDQGPRSRHFADLKKLSPSSDELVASGRWCRTHDPSDGFRKMLVQALAALGVEGADV